MRLPTASPALCLALFGLVGGDALAAPELPYEAVVTAEELYVRSGPGKSFYPTGKLKRGDRVTVKRHDPGGKFMILPPKGSFSWIRSEYVRISPQESSKGTVIENNVVVRVGSEFGDERDVIQWELNKGQRVTILGQKSFSDERGTIRMYKIDPPAGEYRWIDGAGVVPLDEWKQQQRQQQPDPFEEDKAPVAKSRSWDQGPELQQPDPKESTARTRRRVADRPVVRITKEGAVLERGADMVALNADRQRLAELDNAFRAIVARQPAEWNLGALKRDYSELQASAATGAMAAQVQLRLDAVERYQTIQREYAEFAALASETRRRDAALYAEQVRRAERETAAPQNRDRSRTKSRRPARAPDPRARRGAPRARAASQSTQKIVGAGIVQRSATSFPGAPRYVLLAPNGRILAYLSPAQGVDLERVLGRSMGVFGRRGYQQELQTDLIKVTGYKAVRLKP